MIEIIRPKSVKKDKDVRAMTVDEESKFINYLLDETNVHFSVGYSFI